MQGLLGPQVNQFTCERVPWSRDAHFGLLDTFYGAEKRIRDGVESGRMELFRVNGDSWLVIERMPGMLFIWCYQGRGLICLIHQFREYARVNGFQQLSFFTYRRAALRALRRFRPRLLYTHNTGELQYVIDVKAAA